MVVQAHTSYLFIDLFTFYINLFRFTIYSTGGNK